MPQNERNKFAQEARWVEDLLALECAVARRACRFVSIAA